MIYLVPTKRGLGVELWGTYEDLDNFYDVIGKFWNDEQYRDKSGFENRDKLISGFSYEIRKAKQGSRKRRNSSHFLSDLVDYYGTNFSWVHFLFSITAIKYNMRFYETSKFDISVILHIEFWLEKAMNTFDKIGSKDLTGFINDGIYGANEYIYQTMRSVHAEYFMLDGGKRAFRKLPDLLKCAVYYTEEYKEYQDFLKKEAKQLNCAISDLEINDDHINYEHLKW